MTKLYAASAVTASQIVQGIPAYNEGYDLNRLFGFKWAGLDPATGDPRGYVNGQPTDMNSTANINAVFNAPASTATYIGSSVPVVYGSFRNTFSYGSFSLSANLLYKLGYYFRRSTSRESTSKSSVFPFFF